MEEESAEAEGAGRLATPSEFLCEAFLIIGHSCLILIHFSGRWRLPRRQPRDLQESRHFCCTSAASLLHFGCTSAAPRLHLGCTSAAHRLHFGCISAALRLHLDCISAASRPHFCCASRYLQASRRRRRPAQRLRRAAASRGSTRSVDQRLFTAAAVNRRRFLEARRGGEAELKSQR